MSNLYENLGFETPKVLENPYGIKIYIGTKGKDDWCVEIPKRLVKKKVKDQMLNDNLVFYFVSEKTALSIASEWISVAM